MAAMTHRRVHDIDIELAREVAVLRAQTAEAAKLEAEADLAGERVATEQENRRLRFGIAIAALVLMGLQVVVANGVFGWYGVAAGWDVPSAAMTAWLGTTVVEVVAVVLVIVNYLFPEGGREFA
jgi:hypothetical protein